MSGAAATRSGKAGFSSGIQVFSAQYDIDGVEFDRARYPSTDCGYDNFTRALYRSEKNEEAPSNPNDSGWMRWRALCDSLKSAYA
jgi:hypothetical protein